MGFCINHHQPPHRVGHHSQNIISRNITINNGHGNSFLGGFLGGFTGASLFGSGFAQNTTMGMYGMYPTMGTSGMYPTLGTTGMYPTLGTTGMYPTMGMIGGYPTIPSLTGTTGVQTTSTTATQTDTAITNIRALFPKCAIVSDGGGQYTARAEDGTLVSGTYEEVRDGLQRVFEENSSKSKKTSS